MTAVPDIAGIVDRVRAGQQSGMLHGLDARRDQLKALRRMLVERDDELAAALGVDLGKPPIEAYTAEIVFTINEIDHALEHIEAWSRPEKVALPLAVRPGAGRIRPEPLGTACIIAPWNYPVQLLLAPAVPALAAGNAVVLKPSEVAPAVAELLERLIGEYLDPQVVGVVTGAVDETTELLAQRFDHIFYTGNGTVGRIVMKAAAEHLTPVTLELGGKSPAIVAADANIDVTARRIVWSKFLNAGQTCVAPDYVLVEQSAEQPLVAAMARTVTDFYGSDPAASSDYARIINERHHDRLTGLLDGGGYAETAVGGEQDRDSRYLAPTILTGVKPDAPVMAEEIFGPILPVLAVASVDEAIDFVNERDRPLALYAFGDDKATLGRIVEHTSSGGAVLNHAIMHLAVHELPFGGVGASGMGAYHGKAGFDVFQSPQADS
ncbi:aldehyde dehydrogenase family protein [Euzebya tangerina]|uniref:aldehyde dehydrogenase family protein n=1 Tax=Euzebya tangerina TaxID=591198 RepID=UPI00196B6AF8|nr:aldehyde dehydrogenase family protein [Euzebya tangerina]